MFTILLPVIFVIFALVTNNPKILVDYNAVEPVVLVQAVALFLLSSYYQAQAKGAAPIWDIVALKRVENRVTGISWCLFKLLLRCGHLLHQLISHWLMNDMQPIPKSLNGDILLQKSRAWADMYKPLPGKGRVKNYKEQYNPSLEG